MRIFVDAITNDIATLLLGDDESVRVQLPACWLHDGVHEGAVLQAQITIENAKEHGDRQEIDNLYEALRRHQGKRDVFLSSS